MVTVDADCVLTMIDGSGVTVTETTGVALIEDEVEDCDDVAKQYGLFEPLVEIQP